MVGEEGCSSSLGSERNGHTGDAWCVCVGEVGPGSYAAQQAPLWAGASVHLRGAASLGGGLEARSELGCQHLV